MLIERDSGRFAPLVNYRVLRFAQNDEQEQRQKQVPCEDDKQEKQRQQQPQRPLVAAKEKLGRFLRKGLRI